MTDHTRADEVRALAAFFSDSDLDTEQRAGDALREYAALLDRQEADDAGGRIVISPKLREAFEQHVADRCAPLVEFVEKLAKEQAPVPETFGWYQQRARAVLRAYREGQGDDA